MKRYVVAGLVTLATLAVAFGEAGESVLKQGPFTVTSSIDRAHFELGQSARLTYRIEGPANVQFSFPEAEKIELKPLTVKDAVNQALPAQGERKVWEIRLKVTAYETGNLSVPEWEFSYQAQGSAHSQKLRAPGLKLQVDRVPAGPADQPGQIRDAKGLQMQPIPLILWLLGLLFAAVLSACGYALRRWWRRPRVVPTAPILPPYPWALQQLEQLREQRWDKEGRWEEYYEKLTYLLRFYLGWRTSSPLLEQTTSEILKTLTLKHEPHRQLKEILEVADLVKFARLYPTMDKSELHLRWASALVEQHAPPADEPKTEQKSEPKS